jgi:hypothetical protein
MPPSGHGLTGVVNGISARDGALLGGVGEVEEGLASEFGDTRIRMPQEGQQHAEPAELAGVDSDDRDRFRHKFLLLHSSAEMGNL